MLSPQPLVGEALTSVGAHIRSPLALTGMMISILRHRFSSDFQLDFHWDPISAEDPTVEHPDSTIRIEAGGEANRDLGVVKPGIYVNRQPIHIQKLVLDDMHTYKQHTGDRSFLARGTAGFTIVCEADSSGTSSVLADLVLSTFMMGSNLIEKTFNIYQLGPYSISATAATRQEKEIYETHVSVGMQYDLQWANIRLAPLFKEIVLKYGEDENYFIETYTRSILTEQE